MSETGEDGYNDGRSARPDYDALSRNELIELCRASDMEEQALLAERELHSEEDGATTVEAHEVSLADGRDCRARDGESQPKIESRGPDTPPAVDPAAAEAANPASEYSYNSEHDIVAKPAAGQATPAAAKFKATGNLNFKNNRYAAASAQYAKALMWGWAMSSAERAVLHANRAAAALKEAAAMRTLPEPTRVDHEGVLDFDIFNGGTTPARKLCAIAYRDATLALKLRPGYVKALYRRAQAYCHFGDFAQFGVVTEPAVDLLAVLRAEPANPAARAMLLKRCVGITNDSELVAAIADSGPDRAPYQTGQCLSVDDLPDTALLTMFEQLATARALCAARGVCRRWRYIAPSVASAARFFRDLEIARWSFLSHCDALEAVVYGKKLDIILDYLSRIH